MVIRTGRAGENGSCNKTISFTAHLFVSEHDRIFASHNSLSDKSLASSNEQALALDLLFVPPTALSYGAAPRGSYFQYSKTRIITGIQRMLTSIFDAERVEQSHNTLPHDGFL